jgi:cellulose synthase/poly-beta-1,6-N-acetylglucosamine synthase-like glycosyltransferase
MTPTVSVLLPVYNGANYLSQAMDSLLKQTFTDFEVIAINDGSKDSTGEVLNAMTDPRIRVFHQDNMGLAATLNRALSLAKGQLIARQDHDDLSRSDRFAKQVKYMQTNPDCVLLGTAAEIWVGDKPSERNHDHPQDHELLVFDLLFNNPFVHSSIMMRRDVVVGIGGYTTDSNRLPTEDYELWSRMSRQGRIANLAERLLVYREVPSSLSRAVPNPFIDCLVTISAENLAIANGQSEVSSVMTDIAALTHTANNRLSNSLNMNEMAKAVQNAAKNIAGDNQLVMERASKRIKILRYQAIIFLTNAEWALRALRKMRHLIRRFT